LPSRSCMASLMDMYKTGSTVISQVFVQVSNVYTPISVFPGNTRKVCLHLPTPLHQSLHGHVACHKGQSLTTHQSLTGNCMCTYICSHSYTHTLLYVQWIQM
jgi:hypothetical protein